MLAEQDLTPLVPLSIPPEAGERGISKIRRTGERLKVVRVGFIRPKRKQLNETANLVILGHCDCVVSGMRSQSDNSPRNRFNKI
jgi:hypothetical protein